jgi:hypothetical protein
MDLYHTPPSSRGPNSRLPAISPHVRLPRAKPDNPGHKGTTPAIYGKPRPDGSLFAEGSLCQAGKPDLLFCFLGFFDCFIEAIGANAVSEPGAGACGEIGFDRLPIVSVITDFMAPGANGQ